MHIGLTHFLVLSAAMFCMGVLCLLSRRNAIGLLMGIELIVNAANINFVAFSHFFGNAVGRPDFRPVRHRPGGGRGHRGAGHRARAVSDVP